jgi:hypothetical protein
MIIAGLIVQAIICFILLVDEILLKKFKNFASSIFLLIYFILFIVVPLLLHTFFEGARSIVRDSEFLFREELIYHILNVYGILLLVSFFVMSLIKYDNSRLEELSISKVFINSLALLIIAGYFIFLYSTGMSVNELFISPRFSWFNEASAFILGIGISHYFFSLTPIYLYTYLSSKKSISMHFLFILSMSLLIVYGVLSQDRKWLLYLVSGVVAYVYKSSGNKIIIKGKYLVFGGLFFFILFVSQYLRDYLSRLVAGQVSEDFFIEMVSWFSFLVEFGDISYFYRASAETIKQTFDFGIIEPFGVIRRNVLFFIPASWSGGLKPEDLSAIFSDLVQGGDSVRRGNMPPGFLGLFVMSFGVVATTFIVPFIAIALKYMDKIFFNLNSIFAFVFISSYLSFILLLFRGDDSSAFYFVIFGTMILTFVKLFFSLFGSKNL